MLQCLQSLARPRPSRRGHKDRKRAKSMQTINCADCGRPRKTKRSNTKYCYPCRLLRNVAWIGLTQAKCEVCQNRFAPLERNAYLCGNCDTRRAPGDPKGTCALCHAEDVPLVDRDVSVCRACATSIEKRPTFHAALIKKQKAARA